MYVSPSWFYLVSDELVLYVEAAPTDPSTTGILYTLLHVLLSRPIFPRTAEYWRAQHRRLPYK